MNFAIEPPPLQTRAVAGVEERFPVNRVFCVGRNCAAHAREMGEGPDREPPFFFMKLANAVTDAAQPARVPYPSKTQNDHQEVELVVAIGKGGRDIAMAYALSHVCGYTVGLDMTRRDLQLQARNKGRPWEFGKSFALPAPTGALHRVQDIGHLAAAAISLTVNGQPRQASDINKVIWPVSECIAYLSGYETLEPGDIIMTGTPKGTNAVVAGDVMRGAIAGLGEAEVTVGA